MSKKRDEINVYWAPSKFLKERESWNMIYHEPEPLLNFLTNNYSSAVKNAAMFRCPATKNMFKNIFVAKSMISEKFSVTKDVLESARDNLIDGNGLPLNSKLAIRKARDTSLKGYLNITYGMGWTMFADEPLELRFSAPYIPSTTPIDGALLACGEYDIGQWFRGISLDYHIPIASNDFEIKENDPLAFFEFKTDKKINFKRFTMSKEIYSLMEEFSSSSDRYWSRVSLNYRYNKIISSDIKKIVMHHINQNLIDI